MICKNIQWNNLLFIVYYVRTLFETISASIIDSVWLLNTGQDNRKSPMVTATTFNSGQNFGN